MSVCGISVMFCVYFYVVHDFGWLIFGGALYSFINVLLSSCQTINAFYHFNQYTHTPFIAQHQVTADQRDVAPEAYHNLIIVRVN